MRSRFGVLLCVFVSSCASGELQQERGDDGSLSLSPLVTIVCDRHDEYVRADVALDESGKAAALADSILFRTAFRSENVEVAPLMPTATAVLDRHDAYINSDAKLTPSGKKLALISSANIRRTMNTAAGIEPATEPAPPPSLPASRPASVASFRLAA